MTARIFTPVWGSHLDLLQNFVAASLGWKKNASALRGRGATWEIYTLEADANRCFDIASSLGIKFTVHLLTERETNGEMQQQAFLEEMTKCVEEKRPMLTVMPDHVFGDGTIETLLKVGDVPKVCVGFPHIRVEQESFTENFEGPYTNAQLVSMAFKYPHKTWVEGNGSRHMTNTWCGGVVWNKISDNLYAVQHRLPSCFLANLEESDIVWLKSSGFAGGWDHIWPSKLVREERQRIIGSSDACFVAEMTPRDENHPPLNPKDEYEPDRYSGSADHNRVNRNLVSIFRAE